MKIATDVVFVSPCPLFFRDAGKLRQVGRHHGWRHPAAVSRALREGFAVNKRLGRELGGIIHAVTSALMSALAKYLI